MRKMLEQLLLGNYLADRRFRAVLEGFIHEAVAVDVQNVFEWSSHEAKPWGTYSKLVPRRLPFPSMFLEWTAEEQHQDGTITPLLIGCNIFEEVQAQDGVIRLVIATLVKSAYETQPMAINIIGPEFTEEGDLKIASLYTIIETNEGNSEFMNKILWVVFPALGFFNCKNVEIRRLEHSRKQAKQFERKFHITKPEYHVIEIHKATVRNVYERGISQGIARHACMVRGHFKTYTEENKLLGKHIGTYFWESHVRGEIGTPTLNDYRVHEPQHKGDCQIG